MSENRKLLEMNVPMWFDGKSINEALFCEDFLRTRQIIFANGAFFTPDGRVTDDLPLRGEIFEELKYCAVNNIPRKISNIIEIMKLAAHVEDFPPEQDRIHLANGTLMLDGTFTEGKPDIVRNRLPVFYRPDTPKPVLWLSFLNGLLYPEDIPTLQEFIGYCLIPSNKGQRMMVIKGNGGEGKSQIGAVLGQMLGSSMKDGSIGKISENRFARADLEHILLCVDHGGYEYARQFYEEAYKSAVEIVGGEQYILSAVMHADEINRAMSEALGKDVFHYHLHVVYVPVVEKQILWSKRCKDEALRGTVKETIMQVSRSKKWLSKPAVDKDGKPILQVNGKPVLRKSYSVLQDDFFQHMRAAGYTDVERGERDSTEEHLTVTQFKVAKEKQRLEAVTAELNQKEAQLDDTTQAAEKKKQELKSLQAQTKAATGIAVTVQELESMGKKSFTGNIVLTPDECRTLKNYAVSSFAEKAEKLKYQQKYETAKKDAGVWKKRYEKLLEQAQPYLDAVKLAPERVRAFLNAVLTRGKEKQDIPQERGRKRKESTIDR